jgi:hypothetical protein
VRFDAVDCFGVVGELDVLATRFDCGSATTVDSNAVMWLVVEIVTKIEECGVKVRGWNMKGLVIDLHPSAPWGTASEAGSEFAMAAESWSLLGSALAAELPCVKANFRARSMSWDRRLVSSESTQTKSVWEQNKSGDKENKSTRAPQAGKKKKTTWSNGKLKVHWAQLKRSLVMAVFGVKGEGEWVGKLGKLERGSWRENWRKIEKIYENSKNFKWFWRKF